MTPPRGIPSGVSGAAVLASHAPDCGCPPCRSVRGEREHRGPVWAFRVPGPAVAAVEAWAKAQGYTSPAAAARALLLASVKGPPPLVCAACGADLHGTGWSFCEPPWVCDECRANGIEKESALQAHRRFVVKGRLAPTCEKCGAESRLVVASVPGDDLPGVFCARCINDVEEVQS